MKHIIRNTAKKRLVVLASILVIVTISIIMIITQMQKNQISNSESGVTKSADKNVISRSDASTNPLSNSNLYVNPQSKAAQQAKDWRVLMPQKAALMDKLAALPTAKWLTSIPSLSELSSYLTDAKSVNATPVLVAYYLPHRDCGRYSGGGAVNAAEYQNYIAELIKLVGDSRVVVILEPDALASINSTNNENAPCLSERQQAERYALLREAIGNLKSRPGTTVYVDAGNSEWVKNASKMANRLSEAGIAQADGFSLNVSNFQLTSDSIAYGQAIGYQLKNKHFVIDTSRNGKGAYINEKEPDYSWCNPPGRALGHFPTVTTGEKLVDAYLFIKYPGESDGQDPNSNKCFDGGKAGSWWPEYALGLIERWPSELQP